MNRLWRKRMKPLARGLLEAFDDALENWWQNGVRQPSAGSLQAEETLSQSQYATRGQPEPVKDAYAIGAISLRHSQEHLWGAIDSIFSKSMFSSFALARCSLESTARGYWLLDPTIGVKERLRREAQYYAYCLAEVRKMLCAGPQDALSAEVDKVSAHEKQNLDWARSHQLTQKRTPAQLASISKGFTDLVSELIRDIPEGDDISAMVYRWLSGTVHSNPVVLLEFGQRAHVGGYDEHILRMRASSGTVWLPIWLAARGLQIALIRLADVRGWESPENFLGPAVAKVGELVDSDIEFGSEKVGGPTIYRQYLRRRYRH